VLTMAEVLMPVNSMSSLYLHRHGPSVGQARKLKLFVHLANELFVGHSRTPLLAWLEHDRSVIHIQGSIVSGAVRATHGTKDSLHFRGVILKSWETRCYEKRRKSFGFIVWFLRNAFFSC
jgi:hypothetical protein